MSQTKRWRVKKKRPLKYLLPTEKQKRKHKKPADEKAIVKGVRFVRVGKLVGGCDASAKRASKPFWPLVRFRSLKKKREAT